MTQGIVSIRKDMEMIFKVITGHDGKGAVPLAQFLRKLQNVPILDELHEMADEAGFGHRSSRIILERSEVWNKPKAHVGPEMDFDLSDPDTQRYFDTFNVAEFNPRWKFGTAAYVEVVDF